jgi:hypothetical protein
MQEVYESMQMLGVTHWAQTHNTFLFFSAISISLFCWSLSQKFLIKMNYTCIIFLIHSSLHLIYKPTIF